MFSQSPNLSFSPDKKPTKDRFSRTVFCRAPELTYDCAADLWQKKNQEIRQTLKRINAQLVVLTPHQDDVTYVIYKSLKRKPLGRYPVATTIEQEFPDGELKLSLIHISEPTRPY